MDELELISILSAELQNSIGQAGGKLSEDRRRLLAYFNGEISIEAAEGRSSIVARNVLEAVSWATPPLLSRFSTDKIFTFQPNTPEEEQTALVASDYCNWILHTQNEGFSILHTWILDSLITRTAYIKCYWSEERECHYSTYTGLTDPELEQLTKTTDDVEIVEQTSYDVPLPPSPTDLGGMTLAEPLRGFAEASQPPDMMPAPNGALPPGPAPAGAGAPPGAANGAIPLPPPPTSIRLHDVKLRTFETKGKVKIINISPDEILVSGDCPGICLDGRYFVAHRSLQTVSDLREMGFDEADIQEAMNSPSSQDFNQERVDRFLPDQDFINPTDRPDEPGKRIWLTEAYARIDWDGDKIAELRRIVFAGEQPTVIFSNEPADEVPIIALSAFPQPHKHQSLSLADLVVDLQDIKSVLMRQSLDSLSLSTAPRIIIDEMSLSENSVDDLLNTRAGSVVRVANVQGVQPLIIPFVGRDVLPLVQYVDETQAQRSGVSRQDMGLDPQAFANQSATSAGLISAAGTGRIELIARLFAEQIKVLGRRILSLVVRHQQQPQIIKVTGSWLKIDPSTWRESMDLSIGVGLGAANKQEKMQHLMAVLQIQQQVVMAQGGFGGLVSPTNVYDVLSRLTEAAGLEGEFFSDPKTSPMPQKSPEQSPQAMKAMADIQAKIARTKADIEASRIESQNKIALENLDAQNQMRRDEASFNHQMQIEQLRAEMDLLIEQMKLGGVNAANPPRPF